MALKHGQKMVDLKVIYAREDHLKWIGIRPNHRAPLDVLEDIDLITNQGLSGDHLKGSSRQVTLMQFEYLDVIAKLLGKNEITAEKLRRNLLVSGININNLRKSRFSIGNTILEGTDYCHPCSRMEENLGEGGYNAVRGHGGITAHILQGGAIRIGNSVKFLSNTLSA